MKSSTRKEVLVSKVLAKLYPADVSYSSSLQQPTQQSEIKTESTQQNDVQIVQSPTESSQDSEKAPPQKVYTASLPPEDYVPGSQNDCRSSNSEHSENSEDTDGDNFVRASKRRRRKKKPRSSPQVAIENENKIPPPILHSQTSDCVHINKNKRRKLQRKRQKERLKAAGLWPKTRVSDLIDQPERCDVQTETLNYPNEMAMEEELRKKSGDLLDFLEATQEIYFKDSKSRCETDVLSLDVILETLNQIKSREMSSSDVTALHHLKTLVLLQDIERLRESLESFKEHSSLPVDYKMVLCSLFYYWITDILPMRKNI